MFDATRKGESIASELLITKVTQETKIIYINKIKKKKRETSDATTDMVQNKQTYLNSISDMKYIYLR